MHARLWRWRVPIGVATAAVAGGCVTRMLLTPKPEPNRSDEASRARLAVSRQAPKVVRVAYRDAEGRAHMARIDERRLHLETQRQLAALEASRPALHAEAMAAANAQLDEVFARLQGDERVSLLADWYYAYTTAYELLGGHISLLDEELVKFESELTFNLAEQELEHLHQQQADALANR